MAENQVFDITIVGGGPTGLFGAFYAGMREMSTKIIDSLEELGGQLITLYPEKYIYDMPGFPRVLAKDLVRGMAEQGLQYGATVVLGQKVTTLERREDGIWILGTEPGETHRSRTVLITAGAGGFTPRKLPLRGTERFEGRGIHYFVRDLQRFADRRVLIVGGGDSAVDWALNLHPLAEHVTLIHRRDGFRAHESSVQELMRSCVEVKLFWELADVRGDTHVQEATIFENRTQERQDLQVDEIILSLGFHADLGPIKTWGLEMKGNAIVVNSRMETNLPGVFVAGDVATYDGKLKLIATGVGEATIAANHAKVFLDPASRAFPGHSSEMVR
ncbi:MAG: NAD(P)/FAD-dependent oxidoreductase [Armatimonadetes bacterium]|nr:NAD(P)/FAD-dependent oxidoreductase [Armatimonadota bacterium]